MRSTHPLGLPVLAAVALCLAAAPAMAGIDGLTGTTFNLSVGSNRVSTPDGSSILVWGYRCATCTFPEPNVPQFPGPTLIVNQGDTVSVTLRNSLTIPPPPPATGPIAGPNVSIVFPGMDMISVTGGVVGNVTREAPADGTTVVTYQFKASHAGTYMYHSGTREDLEIEMGLVGALIVRPTGFPAAEPGRAYYHPATSYDREFLFVIQEMDPSIHNLIDGGYLAQVDNTAWWPVYWFFNGRNAPDTLAESWPTTAWMPAQPYNCAPRMHPGENVLLRTVSVGRDVHPFHHHGNHSRVIAKEGRLLESAPGMGPDLSYLVYSVFSTPAETTDSIFSWTGQGLGWDFYGHTSASDPLQPGECVFNGVVNTANPLCDHGKAVPVTLPANSALQFGEFWSGSPFLGKLGVLPPGAGINNTTGGYFFMWHSHTEKEIVNNNIFPGGMMTMGVVEAPSVPID